MDIRGPLPVTKSGNKYLVVFGDRYFKAMRVVAVPNITTETLARAFVLDWVAVYAIPLLLLTDNGTQFISKFFHTVCRLLGVKQLLTTAYHSSTNGQVERSIKLFSKASRTLCLDIRMTRMRLLVLLRTRTIRLFRALLALHRSN
jgi:transposase InsO family protein